MEKYQFHFFFRLLHPWSAWELVEELLGAVGTRPWRKMRVQQHVVSKKERVHCIAAPLPYCVYVLSSSTRERKKVRTDGLEGVGRQLTNKQSDLSLLPPAPPVSTQKAKAKRSRRTGTVQPVHWEKPFYYTRCPGVNRLLLCKHNKQLGSICPHWPKKKIK